MKASKQIILGVALALIGLIATNGAYGQSSHVATGDNRVMQAVADYGDENINISVNESLCNMIGGVIQSSLTAQQEGASYQWIDCNNGNAPIPNATSRTFVVPANGSYAVKITLNGYTATSICKTVNCSGGGSGGGGCQGVTIDTEVSTTTLNVDDVSTITLEVAQQSGATYQWYQCLDDYNSEPITNATSHTFSPTVSGAYAVVIAIGECSAYSEWKPITITTGADNILANPIAVYPNPVQDELKIETGELKINSVEILDLTGRTVETLRAMPLQAGGYYLINVSSLPTGVYLIKTETDKGATTARFVKQ